ncbi:hypothetical protein D3C74_282820 [compost metagenome]
MRDQEHRIMILIVGARHRQHDPRHPADRKDRNKGEGIQHRRRKLDAPLLQRKQPVENLDPGWNGNRHRRDREDPVDHYAVSHRIEVVRPYDKRQQGNDDHAPYHGFITIQIFA